MPVCSSIRPGEQKQEDQGVHDDVESKGDGREEHNE